MWNFKLFILLSITGSVFAMDRLILTKPGRIMRDVRSWCINNGLAFYTPNASEKSQQLVEKAIETSGYDKSVFWTDCKPSKEDRIFRTNRGNGKSQCDNGNGPIKDRSSDVTKECMSFNIKTLKYKKRKCMKSKLQDIPGFCLVKEEPTVTTFAPTTPAPSYETDGPFGGDGSSWTDLDVASNGVITAIELYHGTVINSIRARYGNVWGSWHGDQFENFESITLSAGEAFIGLEMTYGAKIDTIILFTDSGAQYGPYGQSGPNDAESKREGCELSLLEGETGPRLANEVIASLTLTYRCP